jgi:hypothetical protein
MFRLLPIVYALSLVPFVGLVAQTVPPAWPPLSNTPSLLYAWSAAGPLRLRAFTAEPADTVARPIKPTYWKEGGVIGAVPMALFLGWLTHGLCQDPDGGGGECTGALVGGALGGGLVGFLAGALIGGQFPKHPKSTRAEPI